MDGGGVVVLSFLFWSQKLWEIVFYSEDRKRTVLYCCCLSVWCLFFLSSSRRLFPCWLRQTRPGCNCYFGIRVKPINGNLVSAVSGNVLCHRRHSFSDSVFFWHSFWACPSRVDSSGKCQNVAIYGGALGCSCVQGFLSVSDVASLRLFAAFVITSWLWIRPFSSVSWTLITHASTCVPGIFPPPHLSTTNKISRLLWMQPMANFGKRKNTSCFGQP